MFTSSSTSRPSAETNTTTNSVGVYGGKQIPNPDRAETSDREKVRSKDRNKTPEKSEEVMAKRRADERAVMKETKKIYIDIQSRLPHKHIHPYSNPHHFYPYLTNFVQEHAVLYSYFEKGHMGTAHNVGAGHSVGEGHIVSDGQDESNGRQLFLTMLQSEERIATHDISMLETQETSRLSSRNRDESPPSSPTNNDTIATLQRNVAKAERDMRCTPNIRTNKMLEQAKLNLRVSLEARDNARPEAAASGDVQSTREKTQVGTEVAVLGP